MEMDIGETNTSQKSIMDVSVRKYIVIVFIESLKFYRG